MHKAKFCPQLNQSKLQPNIFYKYISSICVARGIGIIITENYCNYKQNASFEVDII